MSKLLVVGMGPLLDEGVRHFGGQCLRTWYFVRPLLDDGHTVRLVTLPIYDPDDPERDNAALVRRSYEGFEYQAFTNCDFEFIHHTLANVVLSLVPDALIAVNNLPAWVSARLPACMPLWADLNGYEMAEKQGQAARTGDDSPLMEAWRRESLVCRRADKFSTVSRPQLHALLGELAFVGRLNQHTFHYHFVHHFPNAYHSAFAQPPDENAPPILRGPVTPPDAFVLLWSGGYNYWTDPRFLFEFLEVTLAASPLIHFVSTGGAIHGYNTQTYAEFQRLVQESPHRERYHLLGWVPAEDLPRIYHEADLGLNVDEPNYETFFGARNRLNNLMAAGVPVLTTYGSEISRTIDEARCGLVCPPGDVAGLAHAVMSMVQAPEQRAKLSERARAFALEEFAPGRLTVPMRDWARRPLLAPDNAVKLRSHPDAVRFLDHATNLVEETAAVIDEHDVLALRKAQIDLDAIRSKGWYSTLKAAKDRLRCGADLAMRLARKLKRSDRGAPRS